jgi:capsule polysaccharide modification protein KpsS
VELEKGADTSALAKVHQELLAIGAEHEVTCNIKTFLFHPEFPVDIRHNAKIFREKLALWATEKLA